MRELPLRPAIKLNSFLNFALASFAVLAQSEPGHAAPESYLSTKQDTLVLEIGVVHGDPNQIFGRISDVVVDDQGNILVLDEQSYAVSWFSPDGRFRDIVGRDGDGPREFRYPVGMAIGPHGNVHVLDAMQRRIAVFELSETGFQLVREVKTGLYSSDICIDGDDIVVLGEVPAEDSRDPILHVISLDGEPIRSFGDPLPFDLAPELRAHRDLMAEANNSGFVHCSGAGTVVVGSQRLGVIRSFSIEGEALWHTELSSFSPVRWVAKGAGFQVAVDPETGFASTLAHVAGGYEGQLVVSVHEGSMTSSGFAIGTIDAMSGAESMRKPFDMVVTAQVGDRLYGFVNDPYPTVKVLRVHPDWLK